MELKYILVWVMILIFSESIAQTDSIKIGFAIKGTSVLLFSQKDSVIKLKNNEPIIILDYDSSNTASVIFRDSSFGYIKNFKKTTATFNIANDSLTQETLAKGPRPPKRSPSIGAPSPKNNPQPIAPSCMPADENSIRKLLLINGIESKEIRKQIRETKRL